MAVVSTEERSAAAGATGVARTMGAAISPLFVGFLFARPDLINLPFFIAGTLKIVYDLMLYREFVAIQPPAMHPLNMARVRRLGRLSYGVVVWAIFSGL